ATPPRRGGENSPPQHLSNSLELDAADCSKQFLMFRPIGLTLRSLTVILMCILQVAVLGAQTPNTPQLQFVRPQGESAPPPVITLQDALDRAKRFDFAVQSAISDAAVAREDRAQAKSLLLPGIINTTQYLGTQGNGVTPSGRYVTNDGVHVYREQ